MRLVTSGIVIGVASSSTFRAEDISRATVTVCAAQYDAWILVHRLSIRRRMATYTTLALSGGLSLSLRGIVSQRLLPQKDNTGRVLAAELLTCTPAVGKLLREQRIDELMDLMRSTKDPGIRTFNASLLDLFQEGKISYELGEA